MVAIGRDIRDVRQISDCCSCSTWIAIRQSQAAQVAYERAQVFYNESRYAEALIACEEAIRQNPDNAPSWMTMGAVCVKLGRAWDGAAAATLARTLDSGWKGFEQRLPQR